MACPLYSEIWLSQLGGLLMDDDAVLVSLDIIYVGVSGIMGQSDVRIRTSGCQTRFGHYRSLPKSSGDCRFR